MIEKTKKGQDCSAWIMENDKTIKVSSTNEIPLGHKIALKDLKVGDTIFKYGHDIGKDDKEIVFRSYDRLKDSIQILNEILKNILINKKRMLE